MENQALIQPATTWDGKIYMGNWTAPGQGTVTNIDQFSEWQWITTRPRLPDYPF